MRYLAWCAILAVIFVIDKYLMRKRRKLWFLTFFIGFGICVSQIFIEYTILNDGFALLLGISVAESIKLIKENKSAK